MRSITPEEAEALQACYNAVVDTVIALTAANHSKRLIASAVLGVMWDCVRQLDDQARVNTLSALILEATQQLVDEEKPCRTVH